MLNTDRIDSIVFDLKQSIDDLSNEITLIMETINLLNKKVENLTKEESNA